MKTHNELVAKWIEKFLDFYWERGEYEKRPLGPDGYLAFLQQAMTAAAKGAAEASAVEKSDHVKRGENKNHSSDEVYSCFECFEDEKFNAAITQSQSQLSAYFENHD